jgi:hypothetical protein
VHWIGRSVGLCVVYLGVYGLSEHFLCAVSGDPLERGIHERPKPCCIDHVQHGRRVIGDGLEELRIVTLLFFRPFAFGVFLGGLAIRFPRFVPQRTDDQCNRYKSKKRGNILRPSHG